MYGVPLKSHLEVIGRDIAVPLEECCSVMYLSGIKEEGLLRINGSSGTFSFSIGDKVQDEQRWAPLERGGRGGGRIGDDQ